ncbi:MAG: hypothetical protein JSS63_11445 [Bacteroidetes bacterium]|nr:hypothetical protein [Bacteroidota bacterium]
MLPTNLLFNLIKSLTKAEKRYFTLTHIRTAKDKNYSILFKEIESQTKSGEYNEAAIKNKYKNEKFVKQLTFTKNYLHNIIVKSLIDFYSNDNLEYIIYKQILSAKIFFRKSLFDDYFRALEKGKLLAEKTEKFGVLIEILKLQMKLVQLKNRRKYKDRNLYNEEKNALRKIENISGYSKLLNTFYSLTKIPDYGRSKILYREALNIFNNELLTLKRNAESATALDMFYLLNIYKSELLEDKEKLFSLSLKRYEVYSKNKAAFSSDNEDKEMILLYSLLYYAVQAEQFDFYRKHLKEYEKKFLRTRNHKIDRQEAKNGFHSLKMNFEYKIGNIKESEKYAERVFQYFRETEYGQNKDELLAFYFQYAKILYEGKNYHKALEVSNIIANHEYKTVRYDILAYTHFLEMFIHFELKNFQLVRSYILAISRKLSHHKEKELSEKIILKLLYELTSDAKKDEGFILKKYYKKIAALKKNKYERPFFNELPVDKWVLKKIS